MESRSLRSEGENAVGTIERLASAMGSSDMGMVENRVKDADWIAGLGMAGIENRLGSEILRLKLSNDQQTYRSAAEKVRAIVRRMDARGRLGMTRKQITEIAHKALRHYLLPVCRRCKGTRWDVIPGTPSLSATPCSTCNGTGIHPLPGGNAEMIAKVVARLEAIEHTINTSLNRTMR